MSDAAPASPPPPDPGSLDGPPWIRDALALAREEASRFAATALGFMRRPGRFSADWLAGRQRALNPLGFVATALGVSSAAGALLPGDERSSLWAAIALALLPYVYYAVIGLVCHPLLRLAGSTRRLSASIAVALFAGGGPGLVMTLGTYLAIGLRVTLFGAINGALLHGIPGWAVAPLALLTYAPFAFYLVTLTRGLVGLHAIGRARGVAAVVLGLTLLAFALGGLHRVHEFSVGVPHFAVTLYRHVPILDVWF